MTEPSLSITLTFLGSNSMVTVGATVDKAVDILTMAGVVNTLCIEHNIMKSLSTPSGCVQFCGSTSNILYLLPLAFDVTVHEWWINVT